MKALPILTPILSLAALFAGTSDTQAGDRRFTYSYEATTAAKGTIEYEQWVTWKARRGSAGDKDQFDFRHELEFGLTDKLQLGIYLSDWSITNEGGDTEADWSKTAVELIYNLTNPTTDFLGVGLYGEVFVGEELFGIEGKLLLQKNIGNWIFVYNATLEAEWEGDGLSEDIGEFKNSFGISYQISPKFSVGAEVFTEVEFEGWEDAGDHAIYVGPNFAFRSGNFFATTTVLFQTTGIDAEPDVQTRLIFGYDF